jgi:hypothetical protein
LPRAPSREAGVSVEWPTGDVQIVERREVADAGFIVSTLADEDVGLAKCFEAESPDKRLGDCPFAVADRIDYLAALTPDFIGVGAPLQAELGMLP